MKGVRGLRWCSAVLVAAMVALPPSAHAANTTVTVHAGALGPWSIVNVDPTTGEAGPNPTTNGTKADFVHGPSPAPGGLGSLHHILGSANDVQREETGLLNGTGIGTLGSFDYWTYVVSNNSSGGATYVQLMVDLNGDGKFHLLDDDFLMFEPRYQNAATSGDSVPNQCPGVPSCVATKKWQHWSPTIGGWWSYKLSTSGPPLLTLGHYATLHPGAALVSDIPAVRLGAGGGLAGDWSNFDGYLDAVTIGSTTYDFESLTVPVDCNSAVDDVSAVQTAVDQAPAGYSIRLKGTCDFTTALPHNGSTTSVEYAAVVLRSSGPATGLTIESDGAPGSATVLGSGTQAAFFIPPGSSGVTIRGLVFSNVSRAVVAVDAANVTIGATGTTVPNPAANVIMGQTGLSSAVLGVATNKDAYGNTSSLVVRYGPAGAFAHTYPIASPALTGFVVAGNKIIYDVVGAPTANQVLAGIDVRAADTGSVDQVEITRNAIWFSTSTFPSFDENAVRVQGMSPAATPAITNVKVHHNSLGRAEDVTQTPPSSSGAGRVGILIHRVAQYEVTANKVRAKLSSASPLVPGGGIVAGDTVNGTISGNSVVVLADSGTLNGDLGAIGVVDDLGTLFGEPAGGPPSTKVTVTGNSVGDPATPGVGAQRGFVVAGSSWVDVKNNTVTFSSDKAIDVAAHVEGSGSPAPVLPAIVTLSVACSNGLQGTTDDPNQTVFEEGGAAGSVGNNFPGGGLHSSNGDCNVPGIMISQTDDSTKVVEGGAPDTYSVALSLRPTADVVVTVKPDAFTTVAPASLTFAAATWYVPQEVTVNAVDDAISNGTHLSSIGHLIASTDAGYNGINTGPLSALVVDNDPGSVIVIEPGGSTEVTEGGPAEPYTVVLGSPPGADVSINPKWTGKRTTVTPAGLKFTPANWSVPQTFNVSAVNDTIRQLPVENVSITHTATSADPNFKNIGVPGIVVQVFDNDMPAGPAILSPPADEVYAGGPITVSGTAEPNTTLEVSESNIVLGTTSVGSSGMWIVGPLGFADGTHTIGAVSIDSAGTRSAKSLRTFTIDPAAPPPPGIVQPTEGDTVTSKFVVIKGTAGPQDTVLIEEGTHMGSTQASTGGTWMIVMTFTAGPHAITARSIAPSGKKSFVSQPRHFIVDGDTTAPDPPVILSPQEGADTPKDVLIQGTTEPLSTVEVFANGLLVGVVFSGSDGAWATPTELEQRDYRLLARASDKAANVSAFSPPRSIFVDKTRPMINIRRGTGALLVGVNTPADPGTVDGTAADNRAVAHVVVTYSDISGAEVLVHDATICCQAGTVWKWVDDPPLGPGFYTVKVVAFDRAGNESIASSVQIVRVAPPVT